MKQSNRRGRKLNQKFPPAHQLIKMVGNEKDCGDKICFLSFQVKDTCVIYTKSDTHPFCNVPCDTTDCATEIFYNVQCPTWFCTFKPTTPVPPTPEPSNFSCSTPACVAAASTSGVLALIVILFLLLLWRKSSLSNRLRARLSLYERLDEQSAATPITPIIRPSRRSSLRDVESSRASWSATNPSAVTFQNIPLNQSVEAETRF